jgi:hypothetical protein
MEYANLLLYWHTISEAMREGALELDLGRNAPGSGPHKFKEKWTGVDRLPEHLYFGANAKALQGVDAIHSGTSAQQRLWMRIPLNATNALGPLIRRELPFG